MAFLVHTKTHTHEVTCAHAIKLISHVLLEFELAGHRSQWNTNDLKVEKLLNASDSAKFLLETFVQ